MTSLRIIVSRKKVIRTIGAQRSVAVKSDLFYECDQNYNNKKKEDSFQRVPSWAKTPWASRLIWGQTSTAFVQLINAVSIVRPDDFV